MQCEYQIDIPRLKEKFDRIHKIKENPKVVRVAYYPFQGKAQIIRLLCEYMHIQYQDLFFSPLSWERYRKQLHQHWVKFQLPFIKDADFLVTETLPCCLYLIQKKNCMELLGKGLRDRALVDQFIWTHQILDNLIATYVSQDVSMQYREEFKKHAWLMHFGQKFDDFQNKAKINNWYMGYLTIIDFCLYVLMGYISYIFPDKIARYPKLLAIKLRLKDVDSIRDYQNSDRAVKSNCPMKFFGQFKAYIDNQKRIGNECNLPK